MSLHENQQKILENLLDHPEGRTLEELSAFLGITKTAAKEHVIKLESSGLITFTDLRGSVGRPKRHYLLSPQGHETFPRKYSWLSNVLLKFLADDLGEAALKKIMTGLAVNVAKEMENKFRSASSTAELLQMITQTMNELGYRSSLKQSDIRKGAVIEATNCVYHTVAKEHPALCSFDIKFIESASGGMDVKLESCIARGGAVCRFCIRKK
jgi:predicted ArsR family transcriptional regulator